MTSTPEQYELINHPLTPPSSFGKVSSQGAHSYTDSSEHQTLPAVDVSQSDPLGRTYNLRKSTVAASVKLQQKLAQRQPLKRVLGPAHRTRSNAEAPLKAISQDTPSRKSGSKKSRKKRVRADRRAVAAVSDRTPDSDDCEIIFETPTVSRISYDEKRRATAWQRKTQSTKQQQLYLQPAIQSNTTEASRIEKFFSILYAIYVAFALYVAFLDLLEMLS